MLPSQHAHVLMHFNPSSGSSSVCVWVSEQTLNGLVRLMNRTIFPCMPFHPFPATGSPSLCCMVRTFKARSFELCAARCLPSLLPTIVPSAVPKLARGRSKLTVWQFGDHHRPIASSFGSDNSCWLNKSPYTLQTQTVSLSLFLSLSLSLSRLIVRCKWCPWLIHANMPRCSPRVRIHLSKFLIGTLRRRVAVCRTEAIQTHTHTPLPSQRRDRECDNDGTAATTSETCPSVSNNSAVRPFASEQICFPRTNETKSALQEGRAPKAVC